MGEIILHLRLEKFITFPQMFANSVIMANIYLVLMMGQALCAKCFILLFNFTFHENHEKGTFVNPLIQVREVNNLHSSS